MKKTLGIILAILLTLALSVTAFAADSKVIDDGEQHTESKDVTATFTEISGDQPATVYHITVAWDVQSSLVFTKNGASYTWNPEKLEYDEKTPASEGWSGDAKVEVTVTNKSNAAITAKTEWKNGSGVTVTPDIAGTQDATLKSAADGIEVKEGVKGEEQTNKVTVTILPKDIVGGISTNAPIGSVNVTIAAKAD